MLNCLALQEINNVIKSIDTNNYYNLVNEN